LKSAIIAKLLPERSQVFLIALAVLAGISLVTCFSFLWHGKSGAWIPFLSAIGLIVLATVLWGKSRRDIDLAGGLPTTITDEAKGVTVTVDPRILDLQNSLEPITKIISILAFRKPLPTPDGIVDSDWKPDPSRKEEAIQLVNVVNERAQSITDSTIEMLRGQSQKQPKFDPPNEPPSRIDNIGQKGEG